MGLVSQSEFGRVGRALALRQGTLITFRPSPHSQGNPNIKDHIMGVVLSSDQYNRQGAHSVFICPILDEVSPAEEVPKIPVVKQASQQFYLRPDLVNFVGLKYITPCIRNGYGLLDTRLVQASIDAFFNIIEYSDGKVEQRPHNFLRYSQVGWVNGVPYTNDYTLSKRRPGVCLTPPSIYDKTGLAFIAPGYGNTGLDHNPYYNVRDFVDKFGEGSYSSAIQLMDIQKGDKAKGAPRTVMESRSVRGIVKKIKGIICPEVRAELTERFSNNRDLLPHVQDKIRQGLMHGRDIHYARLAR